MAWLVDITSRTVTVFTFPTHSRNLSDQETLDGGDVLTGLSVVVRDIFAELDEQGS